MNSSIWHQVTGFAYSECGKGSTQPFDRAGTSVLRRSCSADAEDLISRLSNQSGEVLA
jgi:hypothetical protein